MMTKEKKRRFVIIGVFIVPMVLVKTTSYFYGVGQPSRGAAAELVPAVTETPVVDAARATLSEQSRRAAEKVASLYEQPFGETPFYYDAASVIVTDSGDEVEPGTPSVTVQAILAAANGDVTALINGRMYHVGDEFEKSGWKILSIDNTVRAVTFRSDSLDREFIAAVRIRPEE